MARAERTVSARVVILEKYCKGCGLCVSICPKNVLCISDKVTSLGVRPAAVRQEAECIVCLNCTAVCPDAAIEIIPSGEPDRRVRAGAGAATRANRGRTPRRQKRR